MEDVIKAIVGIIFFAVVIIAKILKSSNFEQNPWSSGSAGPAGPAKPKPRTKTKPLRQVLNSQNATSQTKTESPSPSPSVQQQKADQAYTLDQSQQPEAGVAFDAQPSEVTSSRKTFHLEPGTQKQVLEGISPRQMIIMHEILSKPKGLS